MTTNVSNYLKELRKNSTNSVANRQKEIEDSKKTSFSDDRFWKLSVDKVGNGEALVRFLPPFIGENRTFVEKWSHTFETLTNRWYIENCPTTIKGDCPVNFAFA